MGATAWRENSPSEAMVSVSNTWEVVVIEVLSCLISVGVHVVFLRLVKSIEVKSGAIRPSKLCGKHPVVILVSDNDGVFLLILKEDFTKNALPLFAAGVETLLRNQVEVVAHTILFHLCNTLGKRQGSRATIGVALEIKFKWRVKKGQCPQADGSVDVNTGVSFLVAIKLVEIPLPAVTVVKPVHSAESTNT